MAEGSGEAGLKGRVSEAEWRARVDLAALYRLVALHRWDDMIFTHISARVPGPDNHFLINPFGTFFAEMTASSLVKVDVAGGVVDSRGGDINPAGFTIHGAIHEAREDAHYVIHLHTDHGVAVSAHRKGLLPVSQHALIAIPQLSYHDYEGIALNMDERARLVADLGDKNLMMLRNHGTLAVGKTAAEAWLGIFFLERACVQQVLALSAGPDVSMASEESQAVVRQQSASAGMTAPLAWPGLLRSLDRALPGYDT